MIEHQYQYQNPKQLVANIVIGLKDKDHHLTVEKIIQALNWKKINEYQIGFNLTNETVFNYTYLNLDNQVRMLNQGIGVIEIKVPINDWEKDLQILKQWSLNEIVDHVFILLGKSDIIHPMKDILLINGNETT